MVHGAPGTHPAKALAASLRYCGQSATSIAAARTRAAVANSPSQTTGRWTAGPGACLRHLRQSNARMSRGAKRRRIYPEVRYRCGWT